MKLFGITFSKKKETPTEETLPKVIEVTPVKSNRIELPSLTDEDIVKSLHTKIAENKLNQIKTRKESSRKLALRIYREYLSRIASGLLTETKWLVDVYSYNKDLKESIYYIEEALEELGFIVSTTGTICLCSYYLYLDLPGVVYENKDN